MKKRPARTRDSEAEDEDATVEKRTERKREREGEATEGGRGGGRAHARGWARRGDGLALASALTPLLHVSSRWFWKVLERSGTA